MSTKVKVGIAATIVAALVALIVLDQKTATPPDSKNGAPAGEGAVTVGPPAPAPRDAATLKREEEIDEIRRKGEERFGTPRPLPPAPSEDKVQKGTKTPAPGKEIRDPLEEYVVVDGDSFEKIARTRMGDGKWAGLIAQANPHVKASALRPGQKLILPPKPEKKDDAPKVDEPKKAEIRQDLVFQNKDGQRIYTVQPGDTLSGISVKVYNTARHVEKICDANRIDDPSLLHVGMKLVMPDLPRRETAPAAGTAKTSAPDTTGKKTYTVQPGENLWKIASKIAGDRGIEETMRSIVGLNPDKLKSIGDAVRSGWSLIMPE